MEVSVVVGTMLDDQNLIAVLHYRSIVDLTERLSYTSAWLEYKTLTELVFGKGV